MRWPVFLTFFNVSWRSFSVILNPLLSITFYYFFFALCINQLLLLHPLAIFRQKFPFSFLPLVLLKLLYNLPLSLLNKLLLLISHPLNLPCLTLPSCLFDFFQHTLYDVWKMQFLFRVSQALYLNLIKLFLLCHFRFGLSHIYLIS